ncbi:hypothetical protein NQZ68_021917 [Dissostichus eleginoides]|nr:hypothetical protein NQZ68_021917 [Dissostichus eleginoides]
MLRGADLTEAASSHLNKSAEVSFSLIRSPAHLCALTSNLKSFQPLQSLLLRETGDRPGCSEALQLLGLLFN